MTITQKSVTEWKEAKPVPRGYGPIYNFRKGYDLNKSGRHETADQYTAFQNFLRLQGNRTFDGLKNITGYESSTLQNWSQLFEWQKRAASWDKDQLAIAWKKADQMHQSRHRDAIVEFRDASEKQAKMMMDVSDDLLKVLQKRIKDAEANDEEIPMALVSGLLRAAVNVSEQSRQAWASSLGVNEMMNILEAEINKVQVEDVTDADAYDIPLDE